MERFEVVKNLLVDRGAVYDNGYSPALSPGDDGYDERVLDVIESNPPDYDAQTNESWLRDLLYKRRFVNWKWATKQADTPAQAVGHDSYPVAGSHRMMSGKWG